MSRSANDLSQSAENDHLLELPASVLLPRRANASGSPFRFGQSRSPAMPPDLRTPAGGPILSDTASVPTNRDAAEEDDKPHRALVRAYVYISITFFCQLLLLVSTFSVLRMPLRMMPFLTSLFLAIVPPKASSIRQRFHPAFYAGVMVLIVVLFGLLNAETDSLLAGIATIAFYACILAPLIWVGRLHVSENAFVRFILILWSFSTVSCGVGALQVLFPGRFMPAMSTVVQQQEEESGGKLTYQMANGQEVYRPFGLTDSPGGVVNDSAIVFVFGIGLLGMTKRPLMMAVYTASLGLSLFVTYFTQVRMTLVTCAIAVLIYLSMLVIRGNVARFTRVGIAVVLMIAVCTPIAFRLGGSAVSDRLFSLVAEDAGTVYYKNRGGFLEYTFFYALPMYPVGAGLGRYGMLAQYFSKDMGHGSHSLWAEIQWTAWVYDGGWLMLVAYSTAILLALGIAFRMMIDRTGGEVSNWAAILVSYNVSACAIIFSYSLFMSQAGLLFWLINGLLFAAYQTEKRRVIKEIPAGFESVVAAWKPEAGKVSSSAPVATSPTPFGVRRKLVNSSIPKKLRAILDDDQSDQTQ